MLNVELLQNIREKKKKILFVTKYWDKEITQKILSHAEQDY